MHVFSRNISISTSTCINIFLAWLELLGGGGVTPQRNVKKAGAQLAQREPRNAGIAERVKY
jgi:hypothetical protein